MVWANQAVFCFVVRMSWLNRRSYNIEAQSSHIRILRGVEVIVPGSSITFALSMLVYSWVPFFGPAICLQLKPCGDIALQTAIL